MPHLKPVLLDSYWLTGARPDLTDLVPEGKAPLLHGGSGKEELNACVDHHIFQATDRKWHMWACVRATSVGRILYHWRADSLTQSPWEPTGEIIRADHQAGESALGTVTKRSEFIQSPYVVHHTGRFHMFYGGHSTGLGDSPEWTDPCQMCLMTSVDGLTWERHRNAEGFSRVFVGPGEVRDPCLLKIGEEWILYYAGFLEGDPERAGFFARTSKDLVNWSDWRLIHEDHSYDDKAVGMPRWQTECPYVHYRDGSLFLFRTVNYYKGLTHIYRSDDPFDFGIGDARPKHIGTIHAAAVEIIEDETGQEFLSSSHNPMAGNQLCRLGWK